jgi:hypothetical protein
MIVQASWSAMIYYLVTGAWAVVFFAVLLALASFPNEAGPEQVLSVEAAATSEIKTGAIHDELRAPGHRELVDPPTTPVSVDAARRPATD